MRKTDDKPNAMKAATTPGLLENLQTINLQMEKIQRSLEVIFCGFYISLESIWSQFFFYRIISKQKDLYFHDCIF
jgi:hypothetical protein